MKKKNPITRLLLLRGFLAGGILCLLLILFLLAAQPAQQSYELTNAVSSTLEQAGLQGLTPGIGSYTLYVSVRKWGHIYLYALLGILAACFAATFPVRRYAGILAQRFLAPAVFGVCCAMADEFHQSFVPGREAAWRDVGFDAVGLAAGILLVCAVVAVCRAVQRKRNFEK